MQRFLPISASLVLWGLLSGCGWKERVRSFLQGDDGRKVVVSVGGVEYSQSDLERFFDSRMSDFRDPVQADRVKSKLLDSFVEEKLLLGEAERHKIQPNPEAVRAMLARVAAGEEREKGSGSEVRDAELERSVSESLKMQQYLHDFVLKDLKVTAEECEEYYLKHLGEYVRNDVVHVREILVDDQGQGEKILFSLKAKRNKNFAELARSHSRAASAADGGDLGTFQRGDLPDEFERAIYPLAPGTVSKIVRTKYGFHIFMVEEKILAHQQKLFEVQDEIQERLLLELQRAQIAREVDALMNRIPVEIHQERLGFKYIGTRFGGNSND